MLLNGQEAWLSDNLGILDRRVSHLRGFMSRLVYTIGLKQAIHAIPIGEDDHLAQGEAESGQASCRVALQKRRRTKEGTEERMWEVGKKGSSTAHDARHGDAVHNLTCKWKVRCSTSDSRATFAPGRPDGAPQSRKDRKSDEVGRHHAPANALLDVSQSQQSAQRASRRLNVPSETAERVAGAIGALSRLAGLKRNAPN